MRLDNRHGPRRRRAGWKYSSQRHSKRLLISSRNTRVSYSKISTQGSQKMKRLIEKLPDEPGVYFFRKGKNILYIGKATSLRSRVKSYFSKDLFETRGPKIIKILSQINKIDYKITDSVLEALILEANLIKKYQPIGNSVQKDDKSFNYVVITKEAFPRVLIVRGNELPDWAEGVKATFGPFPHGLELREGLKIIRKIFPFRDTCSPFG